MNDSLIPVCEPTLGIKEREYVADAILSGWISSSGKYLSRFETDFAKAVGASYGVAVCNGTAAIHLALKVIGIGPGDEVILPSFTMIATANAIHYCGARPVFVDADPVTRTIDTNQIEAAITDRTKAILSVTIYGHPSDFQSIRTLCSRHSLYWIEDAAEGHGALYRSEPLAVMPDITTYSFYANKIITTGEGGMVCTNSTQWAERARSLRNLAFPTSGDRRYIHEEVGFNYRMTNVSAALGCAQLERLDELVLARRNNAQLYSQALSQYGDVLDLPAESPWATSSFWMYGVVLRPQYATHTRDEIMQRLRNKGIETRPFFHPMHRQPVYETGESLPVAEWLGQNGFYLPSSSHLTRHDIQRVVGSIENCL